jgi:hypothetical protein
MVRFAFASLLGPSLVLGGCRSCDERSAPADAAPAGPTMPAGMLVPSDAPSVTEAGASSLRVVHHVKGGAFAELQLARAGDRADRRDFEHWRDDSAFLSLDAMTQLHEPFARALPGFDLFLPRLFDGEALERLAAELEAFALRAPGDLAASAREVSALARAAGAQGRGLWVLGI